MPASRHTDHVLAPVRARRVPAGVRACVRAAAITALAVVVAGCGAADTPSTFATATTDPAVAAPASPSAGGTGTGGDGAAGACLAGDEQCQDDPSNGVDVARPVPLTDALPDAEALVRDTTDGATGAPVTDATATDDGLALTVDTAACDVLEDVLVLESPQEVRVLVLTGAPSGAVCDETPVARTLEVPLDAPLGERVLLDLSG